MNLRDPICRGGEIFILKDYMKELENMYPGAREELGSKFPKLMVNKLKITVFVDTDHTHDKVSRRSITGIVIFVGGTPVFI